MRPLAPHDPKRVGPYRTLSRLGSGGMGRVFLAGGPDGRLVAVKLVNEDWLEVAGFRDRFRGEVDASRRVSGAYTAAVIDADTEAAEPWLASEFVPGVTLAEAVGACGGLGQDAGLRLAAGLAAALSVIHQAGLIHRDLKPTNIMLTNDGVRVIDFGIARATDTPGGAGLTRTGWVLGTAGYMSPEQAEGKTVSAAGDVFSLGAVVAMACTGRGPFDGSSDPQTLYNIVHSEPELSRLSEPVRKLVAGCLVKDPTVRPAPGQLLSKLGDLPPTVQPWPPAINELLETRHTEIAGQFANPSIMDRTRQLTRRVTGTGAEAAKDPKMDRARKVVGDKFNALSKRFGDTNRLSGTAIRARDVLIVVVGVLIGLFVFGDLNIGQAIPSDRESIGIGGGELENALTHAGYFGIVIGFQLGGVAGGLTRWIVGKRSRVFAKAAVATAAAAGFILGWLAEHDQLNITLISLGLETENRSTEETIMVLGFGVVISLSMLTIACWVAGRVGIVLALIGFIPSALVGAAWANLSVTGIRLSGGLTIGLASVVGGAIGGAVAYRVLTAARLKKQKQQQPARQW